ncbi:MAG: hypothetical protein R2798_11880 [Chitinophagales bacterium]|nr:hypothetical protein [Bacteroidota bacterium]MCB9043599.1 hypothetical protein [Chitinophagales bacterium]
MNIVEKIGKNDAFVISFENYYGSGWVNYFFNAIKSKINPTNITKNDIDVGWNYSEYEFFFTKEDLELKLEIDDFGPVAIILQKNITEPNKNKLREWANIIATEVENLKNT